MTPGNTLGEATLAMTRLGDGAASSQRPNVHAILLTYDIVTSQYSEPFLLTYTVEAANIAQVFLYYLVTPTIAFNIDGDSSIISPDQITYTPRTVANRSLVGTPQLQNYKSMTWAWTVLQINEYTTLIAHYNPLNPIVTLVYPDETGTWVQRQAVMHPPAYGTQTTQIVNNVTITFTRLLY